MGGGEVEEIRGRGPFTSFGGSAGGRMGKDGNGVARLRSLRAGAGPEVACVGVCRELEVATAAAATGFGGRDGCPDRLPTADGVEAPSSCLNFASIRAILASVLRGEKKAAQPFVV